MNISATIIAFNEENNISRAIESLGFCDEITVVDSGSTDRTRELAARSKAVVLSHEWEGYAKQKNFAAQIAQNDWILSIDADEEVSKALSEEILNLKLSATEHAGYDFPRLAHYCGRWIRHSGWYPDRKIRLYRRSLGRWTGDYIHESVQTQGTVGHLQGDLLHYTCNSFQEHLESIERYTDLAAQELHDSGDLSSIHRLISSPIHAFLKSYLLQLGFLDGAAGFTIAGMAARYSYLKYSKAQRMAKS